MGETDATEGDGGEGGDGAEGGSEARFLLLCALTGLGAGLVGSLFLLGIDALLVWPRRLAGELSGLPLVAASAAITMTMTLLAVALVRGYAPEASGSGVQEIEGAMVGKRRLRWRLVLPVKLFGGLIALGSGLALGREGPTIHMGASVGAALSETYRTSETERRGLLASGAGAGLASAFNAPVGGVLLVIEEMREEFPNNLRTYLGLLVAAVVATSVTQAITGTGPMMPVAAEMPPLGLLPAFLLLGLGVGLVGVLLNASLLRLLDFAARTARWSPYLYPAVIGLAVGTLLVVLPQSVTGGEHVVVELGAQHVALGALVLLSVVRFATLVGSYSSGVPGGIFAPMLALAFCLGLAFAEAADLLLPDIGIDPAAFAICAMGGLFVASVRAPLVGAVLILELTGAYVLMLPIVLTCATAELVAQRCGGRPIYALLLERTLALEARAKGQPAGE